MIKKIEQHKENNFKYEVHCYCEAVQKNCRPKIFLTCNALIDSDFKGPMT